MITDSQITDLRAKAIDAGNPLLARYCTLALQGDSDARATVEDVLNSRYEYTPKDREQWLASLVKLAEDDPYREGDSRDELIDIALQYGGTAIPRPTREEIETVLDKGK